MTPRSKRVFMYKDASRQAEYNRNKQREYRLRKKGVTHGVTTGGNVTTSALPLVTTPSEWGGPDEYGMWREVDYIEPKVNHWQVKHHPGCRCYVCRPPK